MKTSNLSGNALCYAVCMIEMPHLVWGETIGIHHASNQIVVPELPEPQCYSPFEDWNMFGPIIEREKLMIGYSPDGADDPLQPWYCDDYAGLVSSGACWGATPLIAAMRCYCCAILGDEVEIPEGLNDGE